MTYPNHHYKANTYILFYSQLYHNITDEKTLSRRTKGSINTQTNNKANMQVNKQTNKHCLVISASNSSTYDQVNVYSSKDRSCALISQLDVESCISLRVIINTRSK